MSTRIDNIDTKISALTTASTTKSKRMVDDSIFVTSRNLNQSLNVTALIPRAQRAKARELREMLGNESFGVVSFSSVVHERLNYLYAVNTGGLAQSGGENYAFTFAADGPYRSYNWIIEPDESVTYWDDIIAETFNVAGNHSFVEGTESSLLNNTWLALNGNWRSQTAQDRLECYTDGGTNQCLVTENVNGDDLHALADVTLEAEIEIVSSAGEHGIAIRNQKTGGTTTHTYGYGFGIDVANDSVVFMKYEGNSETLLKSWFTLTFAISTVYTLKVVCRGNRFDCFIDTVYVGTVFDETYKAGWHGAFTQNTNMYFNNFSMEVTKPTVANLPVGAYDYNRIRMPDTVCLNDDVSSYGLQRTVIAPSNPVNFKQQIPFLNDPSIQLYYPLQENFKDYSGNNYHLVEKSVHWVDSKEWSTINHAKRFDGLDDYLDTDLEVTMKGDHTCMALFKCFGDNKDPSKAYQTIVNYNDGNLGNGYDDMIHIWIIKDTGYIGCRSGNSASGGQEVATTTDVRDGQWHMVAVTRNPVNNTLSLYLDGVLLSSEVSATDIVQVESTGYFTIGEWQSYNDHFYGDITHVAVWNRVLSAIEIKDIYNTIGLNDPTGVGVKVFDTKGENGLWNYTFLHLKFDEAIGAIVYDSSKYRKAQSSATFPAWSTSSFNKWAKACLDFNGSTHHISMGDDDDFSFVGDVPFSVEAWVNMGSISGYHPIVSKHDGGAVMEWWLHQLSGKIYFQILHNNGSANLRVYYDTALNTGEWYHIVATYDGSEADTGMKIYINGEQKNDATASAGSYTGMTNTTAELRIGRGSSTPHYFDGKIDEVKLVDRELTAEEILWRYENSPRSVDETQWEQVYDIDHKFIGNKVITNGLIKLLYGVSDTQITLSVYADGAWEDILLNPIWSVDDINHIDAQITELKKHVVTLKEATYYEQFGEIDMVWTEYTIRTGSPMVNIENRRAL